MLIDIPNPSWELEFSPEGKTPVPNLKEVYSTLH